MDQVLRAGRSESLYGSEGWGFESLRARKLDLTAPCDVAKLSESGSEVSARAVIAG